MFKRDRVAEVVRAKSKALKVFTDTKAKFEAAISQAYSNMGANANDLQKIEVKKAELEEEREQLIISNKALCAEVEVMRKQINQINSIVGAN